MLKTPFGLSRRGFMAGAAATAGMTSLMGTRAFAQSYPARNINVVVPTAQGGGVEQHARAMTTVWGPLMGTNFEYEFHAGASGQVGYEVYAHRKEKDGYNLLMGNMGAEIVMYATQNPNFRIPEDITYFGSQGGEPAILYVGADSPFETIEQFIEAAQSRTLTVSTSRLPHPATLGALVLAEAVGAQFNMVPFSGGNATAMAAITGEVNAAVSPAGLPVQLGDQVRMLAVLGESGDLAAHLPDVPTARSAFGVELPDLISAVGWGIHTEVWENNAEIRERLTSTYAQAFEGPALEESYSRVGIPFAGIKLGDAEWCQEYFNTIVEVTDRYRDILVGS